MAERTYTVYCGNFDCPARLRGDTFDVAASELPDGELWLCPDCRPPAESVA